MYNDNPTLEELQKVIKRQGRDLTELERKLDYYLKFGLQGGGPGEGKLMPSDTNMLYDHSFELIEYDSGVVDPWYTCGVRNFGAYWYFYPTQADARIYIGDAGIGPAYGYQAAVLRSTDHGFWGQTVPINSSVGTDGPYTLSAHFSAYGATEADTYARMAVYAYANSVELGNIGTIDVPISANEQYTWRRGRLTFSSLPTDTNYLNVRLYTTDDTRVLCDGVQLVPLGAPVAYNPENGLYSHLRGHLAGTIGYAQVTASQSGITTEVDLTGLGVTVNVAAGRRIKITVNLALYSTVAGDIAYVLIKEGGEVLNAAERAGLSSTNTTSLYFSAVITPSAGTHAYKATCMRSSGTGGIISYALSYRPAFILVEDIGAA